jgi:hypothetical protein
MKIVREDVSKLEEERNIPKEKSILTGENIQVATTQR